MRRLASIRRRLFNLIWGGAAPLLPQAPPPHPATVRRPSRPVSWRAASLLPQTPPPHGATVGCESRLASCFRSARRAIDERDGPGFLRRLARGLDQAVIGREPAHRVGGRRVAREVIRLAAAA